MTDSSSSAAAGRPMLSVKDTAALLGFTPTWVRAMLDDPSKTLSGPPSAGRGSPRYVWVDTIHRGSEPMADGSTTDHVAELARQLAEARSELANMTTALHYVNAATDKLRQAFKEQERAIGLLTSANEAQRNATARMAEADALRQEALAPFIWETPPSH